LPVSPNRRYICPRRTIQISGLPGQITITRASRIPTTVTRLSGFGSLGLLTFLSERRCRRDRQSGQQRQDLRGLGLWISSTSIRIDSSTGIIAGRRIRDRTNILPNAQPERQLLELSKLDTRFRWDGIHLSTHSSSDAGATIIGTKPRHVDR
jgi:hypothetical protein